MFFEELYLLIFLGSWYLILFKLYSSINIDPLLGSMNFNIKEKIVLLPAPEGPTKAIIFPLSISKLIFSITVLSSTI